MRACGKSRRGLSPEITANVFDLKPPSANFLVKTGMFGEGPIAEITTGLAMSSWRQMPWTVLSMSRRFIEMSAIINCNNSRRVAARNGLPVLVEMIDLSGKTGVFRPGRPPIIQLISGRDRWEACTAIAAVVDT
jgi:hypothetical protein